MHVDMMLHRFVRELEALPAYHPEGHLEEDVRFAKLPPGKAAFAACTLARHVRGYKLPSFTYFLDSYLSMMAARKLDFQNTIYSNGTLRPGFLYRMSQWYEDGINHAYVYSILVQAFEDFRKNGIVFYDARIDWKQKLDLLCILGDKLIAVDIIYGAYADRSRIESKRLAREVELKKKTIKSSQIGNTQVSRITRLPLSRTDEDCILINGYRLTADTKIDEIIKDIEITAGIDPPHPTVEVLRRERP